MADGGLSGEEMSVTEKVLTEQLRELEADGIVHREVFDEVPPRVEYSLTAEGEALNAALEALNAAHEALGEWGERRIERLDLPRALHPAALRSSA